LSVSNLKMLSKEQRELKHQRETIALQLQHLQENAEAEGKSLIYPNQQEAARECLTHFEAGKLLVMLVAQPGTGKTGTALELLQLLCSHIDDEKCVKVSNAHVVSGMNDTDWRDQFQAKMLPVLSANVRHRSILNKFKDDIASIRNGIILTDECHIAADKSMTVSRLLRNAGLTDINVVTERRVRLFDISATPESTGWDLESWGSKAAVVRLMPGSSYKGFQTMLDENRILQAEPLSSLESVRELFQFFEDRYNGHKKKFFPMRIRNEEWLGFIHIAIVEFGWEFLRHDSQQRVEDIDAIMATEPAKHTIIFIKEFWRASKRLVRTHIGGSYESTPRTRNVSTASQGLIGRFCDNFEYEGDELNPELRPVHFGDKTSIEAYVEWFNNGCDYRKVDYKSTKINSKNGHVKAKASKLHSTNFINLEAVEVQNNNPDTYKRVPIVAQLTAELVQQIKEMNPEEKIKRIRKALQRTYATSTSHREFLAIISNSPCFQFSFPGVTTQRSYKIHIEDVVNAYKNKSNYGLMDCTEEHKKRSCWQVYIDEKENRLCVLWQVFLNIED